MLVEAGFLPTGGGIGGFLPTIGGGLAGFFSALIPPTGGAGGRPGMGGAAAPGGRGAVGNLGALELRATSVSEA